MKYSVIVPHYSHPIDDAISIVERLADAEIVAVQTGTFDLNNSSSVLKKLECRGCGYGESVNKGVKESKGEYIVIMNDDVILAPDFFEKLENIKGDAIVPTVYDYYSKKIESTHASLDLLWYSRLKTNGKHGAENLIPGSAFIIRKDVFERVGGFDPDYFMYYEDTDLSVRLKKEFEIVFSKDLRAFHKHSFSDSGKKRYFLQRNRLFFIVKNCKTLFLPIFLIYFMTAEMGVMLYQSVRSLSRLPIKARIDFLKNVMKFLRKRNAHNH